MVTKKQRRRQLARARAERHELRRRQRESRRRWARIIAVGLAVVLAAAALATWIVLHEPDRAETSMARVYYDAGSVDRTQQSLEVSL